jgi:hypothetical protein
MIVAKLESRIVGLDRDYRTGEITGRPTSGSTLS